MVSPEKQPKQNIPNPTVESAIKKWVDKGIKKIGDLHSDGFPRLAYEQNPSRYSQIRNWVKGNSPNKFPAIPRERIASN